MIDLVESDVIVVDVENGRSDEQGSNGIDNDVNQYLRKYVLIVF